MHQFTDMILWLKTRKDKCLDKKVVCVELSCTEDNASEFNIMMRGQVKVKTLLMLADDKMLHG